MTVVVMIMVVYNIAKREAEHSVLVVSLSICIAFFALGSFIIFTSTNAETAFVGFRLQHLGQPFLGSFWFLYVLSICHNKTVNRAVLAAILFLPVFICFWIFIGDPLNLIFNSNVYYSQKAFPYIVSDFNLIYYFGIILSYGLVLVSCVILTIKIFRENKKVRRFYLVHLFVGLIPLAIGIYCVVLQIPYRRELTSISLCLVFIVLMLYLLKAGAFKVVSKAKYQLFESVEDGIVILNKDNEYLDSNSVAKEIFPLLKTTEIGTSIYKLYDISENLILSGKDKFEMHYQDKVKNYKFTCSILKEDDKHIGSIYMFYDITEFEELSSKLAELATIDELTQVNNRRNFFTLSEQIVLMSRRYKSVSFVAMLDIDHFKIINDHYGHHVGDFALKVLANHCKDFMRRSDIFGRYGGEEFAIVLYNSDVEAARRRLDELRESIANLKIEFEDKVINLTVSVGFAQLNPQDENALNDSLVKADKALYFAKESGRNKVCGFGDIK